MESVISGSFGFSDAADLVIELTENEQAAEQRRAREREADRVSRGIPRYRAAYTMYASAE